MVQEDGPGQDRPVGPDENPNAVQESLERILSEYLQARRNDSFAGHALRTVFEDVQSELSTSHAVAQRQHLRVSWSMGQGNWARVPWIAFLDSRETNTTQRGVYCCFLFRQDMSGVYLTYNQGVTELQRSRGRREAHEILRSRAAELRSQCQELERRDFSLDEEIDLRAARGLGADYEHSTIAYKLYRAGEVPRDSEILQDVEAVLSAYDKYLAAKAPSRHEPGREGFGPIGPKAEFQTVLHYIEASGFTFEPWQVAAYVTALRTKPFVILAGVSGTGKTKLPGLVAEATGGRAELVAVRPDWTDSSEVLGYEDLQGQFRPGPLLQLARKATKQADTHFTCVVDEMNLARVEYYFAELLSRMEDRRESESGGYRSGPLLSLDLREENSTWTNQGLPPNLAIVGTVNMDETTHGFSRKVLDRAFTIEFSDIDLTAWDSPNLGANLYPLAWPVEAWYPRAIRLSGLESLSSAERADISQVVEVLTTLNQFLAKAQLQIGYRTRDEMALFVLHAGEISASFLTRQNEAVDPLDLALHMKVLPRLVGGSNAMRRVLLDLLGWAYNERPVGDENEANALRDDWDHAGRPSAFQGAAYPRTAARLCLMWDRLWNEGFTSYWL